MAVGGPFREYRLTCLLFLSLRLSLHNSAGYDLCLVMVAAIDMLEQGYHTIIADLGYEEFQEWPKIILAQIMFLRLLDLTVG